MAKFMEYKPVQVTIAQGDSEVVYQAQNVNMQHQSGGFVKLRADLFGARITPKINDMPYPPFPQKEEKVTNSYHINDDKNKAIGSVKQAVETLEKTLLARQLEIERVTLEQDAYVATQVRILDGKLLAAIQEDVLIEELEVAIPAHNGVLAKRVESIFDLTGLDKIAELV